MCARIHTRTQHRVSVCSPKNQAVRGIRKHPQTQRFACFIPLEEGISWEAWMESPETLLTHIKLVILCMTLPHHGDADTSNRGRPSLPPRRSPGGERLGPGAAGHEARAPRHTPWVVVQASGCTWVHFVHFKATACNRTNLFWSVPAQHLERRLRESVLS